MSGIPTPPESIILIVIDASHIDVRWTNGSYYSQNQPGWLDVERKPDGGSYAQVAHIAYSNGMECLFRDESLADGTKYYYQIRFEYPNLEYPYGSLYTDYSDAASAVTYLPMTTGFYGSAHNDDVHMFWNDNSQNESGFKIYRDFVLVHTTGPNEESYTDPGLNTGTQYYYQIYAYNALTESGYQWFLIWTGDVPNAVTDVTGYATGLTTIRLNWQDNSNNETGFKIYISTNGTDFSLHDTIAVPNTQTFEVADLVQGTHYWFRVYAYNYSGNSDHSNVCQVWTMANISTPSNVAAAAVNGTTVDITFDDNSVAEDHHFLYRKNGGAYPAQASPTAVTEKNVTHYRNTGLTPGTLYTYKICAQQDAGPAYSAYSAEVEVTTPIALAAPTDLAVSDVHQDTWMRLTWTNPAGTLRNKIYKSPVNSGFSEIADIKGTLQSYKVWDLTADTKYYFKVSAINGAGEGTLTASVNHTTSAVYLPSRFEKLMLKQKAELIYLLEINPLLFLTGWTQTAGHVYETTVEERGTDIDLVYENGTAYTELTTTALTPSTFYFDYYARKLYVHTSTDASPAVFTMTASIWIYITNKQAAGSEVVYNGNYYLPLLNSEGIPDMSQEIKPYFEGGLTLQGGSFTVSQGPINNAPFFFIPFAKYYWENRKIILKAGLASFTYAEFDPPIYTGIIDSCEINDASMVINTLDFREGLGRSVPWMKYTVTDFPNMDTTNLTDKWRPYYFGTQIDIPVNCIDTASYIFEFNNGRVKSVSAVKLNGTPLIANTDYWIDYWRGRLTLASTFLWTTSDRITVTFDGLVDEIDTAITNGAEIFAYACQNWYGLTDGELDWDNIYRTKYARTTTLALPCYKERSMEEIFVLLEHSVRGWTYQGVDGKIGIKIALTAAPSDIRYVMDQHIKDFTGIRDQANIYYEIHVHYNEDPGTERYQWIKKTVPNAQYRSRHFNRLDIYTAIPSETDAGTLGDAIIPLLNKTYYSFTSSRVLFPCQAGDLIYLSREKFPNISGAVTNLLMRIIRISKMIGHGQCSVTVEEV